MTKQELIDAVQAKAKVEITKKATGELIDIIFSVVAKEVAVGDGRQTIPGFGTFSKRHRKARKGINPMTKEEIQIPASNTVAFKPAPALKEKVSS